MDIKVGIPIHVVLGYGEVGQEIARLARSEYAVVPYDPPAGLTGVPDRPADVLHVCVPGALPDFDEVVVEAAESFRPSLILLWSTVRPGTTENLDAALNAYVVHVPIHGRHSENRLRSEMLSHTMYVGCSTKAAFWKTAPVLHRMGWPEYSVVSIAPRYTEFGKLLSTTYYALLIAFMQEVDRLSRELSVEREPHTAAWLWFRSLIADAERGVRIDGIYPGVIGGHCVMPNLDLLRETFPSELWDAIVASNEKTASRNTLTKADIRRALFDYPPDRATDPNKRGNAR